MVCSRDQLQIKYQIQSAKILINSETTLQTSNKQNYFRRFAAFQQGLHLGSLMALNSDFQLIRKF